jgi:hypothetical protein
VGTLRFKQLITSYRDCLHGRVASVKSFVKQCTICQQAKHEHCKSPGLLCSLLVPQGSWQDVSMDFIGLSITNGYSIIMVVADRYTKYAHFFPLKHSFTTASVATLFMNNVVKLHGLPKSILSDGDKIFTSAFWKSLFGRLDVKLHMSSAYHPQTDGQTKTVLGNVFKVCTQFHTKIVGKMASIG